MECSLTMSGNARSHPSADRSPITAAALIALNRADQLRFHLNYAVENGIKKEELIEAVTHLACYAGWPGAMSTIMIARELFSKS